VLKPLGAALEDWSPGAGRARDPLVLLAAGWSDIVGADVSKHSKPSRISGDTLLVTTQSSAWSHQLSMLAPQVLAAVRARLPDTPLRELRFRVGRLTAPGERPADARKAPRRNAQARPASASAGEALARFRSDVEAERRAKASAGWKDCQRCAALVAPDAGMLCVACEAVQRRERAEQVSRLMFEAPWLGYAGTAALVDGLSKEEYESVRSRVLTGWWEVLSRARASKRLSRDRRERSIASSYVVLRSKLAPEAIAPATVRSVLGDELHDVIYGTE
jgi:hypothetical protein